MRVAFVTQPATATDDWSRSVRSLAEEWNTDTDVEVVHLPVSLQGLTACLADLAGVDVIHLATTSRWVAMVTARMAARLGRPVVQHLPGNGEMSRIARLARHDVTLTVTGSLDMRDALDRIAIRSTMIPDPIASGAFLFRERLPFRPRLLSVTNFEPLDNVVATLRAFAIVQSAVPDASLTLFGRGSQEATLRGLAAELGLVRVEFTAPAGPAALAAAYADHDMLMHSPNVDNTASCVLQALACGMPVVSTAAGVVPTIIRHGVNGLLAPLADYETLGHHARRLLAQPDDARALARAARAVGDAHRWPRVRAQWLDAYTSVRRARARDRWSLTTIGSLLTSSRAAGAETVRRR